MKALIPLAMVSLLGCKQVASIASGGASSSRAENAPAEPPAFRWEGAKFRVDSFRPPSPHTGSCMPCVMRFNLLGYGSIGDAGADIKLRLVATSDEIWSIPTEFTVGETHFRASSRFREEIAYPVGKLGELTLDFTGKQSIAFDTPVEVTFAGTQPIRTKLPPVEVSQLAGLFHNVGSGMRFDGEPAEVPAKPTAVALFVRSRPFVVGPGTRVRDVDWVVTETYKPGASRTCGGYRSDRGGGPRTIVVSASASVLTVRDRRTGNVLVEKTFDPPPPTCPTVALGFSAGVKVSEATLKRWLNDSVSAGRLLP